MVHLNRQSSGYFDWADFDRLVVFDDEGEVAFRAALDDHFRHHDGPLLNGQQQAGVDELARPEPQIGVGKRRFEFELTGGGINLIVNHGEFAFAHDIRIALTEGQDSEAGVRPLALLLDRAQGLFREQEDDGDRLELGDDHDARQIAGANDVALVH